MNNITNVPTGEPIRACVHFQVGEFEVSASTGAQPNEIVVFDSVGRVVAGPFNFSAEGMRRAIEAAEAIDATNV